MLDKRWIGEYGAMQKDRKAGRSGLKMEKIVQRHAIREWWGPCGCARLHSI